MFIREMWPSKQPEEEVGDGRQAGGRFDSGPAGEEGIDPGAAKPIRSVSDSEAILIRPPPLREDDMLDFRKLIWSWDGRGGSASDSVGDGSSASRMGDSRSGMGRMGVMGRSLVETCGGRGCWAEEEFDARGDEAEVSTVDRLAWSEEEGWPEREEEGRSRSSSSSSIGVVPPSEGGGLGGGPPIREGSFVLETSSDGGTSPPLPPLSTALIAAPNLFAPTSTGPPTCAGPATRTTRSFEILWTWTSDGGGWEGGERARRPGRGGTAAAY